jgi:hypothetical protein
MRTGRRSLLNLLVDRIDARQNALNGRLRTDDRRNQIDDQIERAGSG